MMGPASIVAIVFMMTAFTGVHVHASLDDATALPKLLMVSYFFPLLDITLRQSNALLSPSPDEMVSLAVPNIRCRYTMGNWFRPFL